MRNAELVEELLESLQSSLVEAKRLREENIKLASDLAELRKLSLVSTDEREEELARRWALDNIS
jgi:hypothetical protein